MAQKAMTSSPWIVIGATTLMLFSMFFGAGNLIFPPMLGVNSGENFWPAILGFLSAGVVLPVLAVIAIVLSGNSVRDLANRAGSYFGLVFSILAYLSIGAFYALPRTGAVSYETAFVPLVGGESGMLSSALFNLAFFGIGLALSWNPNTISSSLGKVLTPMLVTLLIVLISVSLIRWDTIERTPSDTFAENPFAAGLLEGYLTMDAIAALAFSIVVISVLRYDGLRPGRQLTQGTIIAGAGAGAILAVIYVGLGLMGRNLPNGETFDNGANLLANAANQVMGEFGQILFASIVVLACLTTAVGLITSTSEFFTALTPGIKYHAWAIIFSVSSFLMATLGLGRVLSIAAPVIGFIYPPAIALIFITLSTPFFGRTRYMYFTYTLGVWTSVVWSALTTLHSLGWGASAIEPLINWAPMQSASLGWVLPTLVATLVGVALDLTRPAREYPKAADLMKEELNA